MKKILKATNDAIGVTIYGAGGNDFINGGAGNDQFIVDNVNNLVIETAAGGTGARIVSSVTYTLPNLRQSICRGRHARAASAHHWDF